MMHICLSREDKLPLSRQIYRAIKENIVSGKIVGGTKLPSSRAFSEEFHVARNVVIEAYEQLLAEGYLYAKMGSGTYVSEGVILSDYKSRTCIPKKQKARVKSDVFISFRAGIPDLGCIPIKKWAQIYHKIALDIEPFQLDYQNAFGEERLRLNLAEYLNRVRGTNTRPENILITNGAAQSFNLLCQLIASDEYALVENPLSYGLLHTIQNNGISMRPVRLDVDGMVTAELPLNQPKLIFTTPSHQFPMGAILPASRRIELIQYAKRSRAYIVEDDYDSEFRFDGSPIESMQYLAPDRVIYVGTFSKTLMPALRIGYMVLPDELCEKMREAKYVSDIHSPVLEQLTLAEFIKSGAFEMHIRRMRKVYQKKRNHLIFCLKKQFGDTVSIFGIAAGLHLVCSFLNMEFNTALLQKIQESGIEISPMEKHVLNISENKIYKNMLILGYGNTPIEKMESGIELLAKMIVR